MATRKPARSAKKAAKTAKPAKPARVAKKAAKAEQTAKAAKAPGHRRSSKGATALVGGARASAADTGGHLDHRTASIQRGIMRLRERLRAPSRTSMPRSRTGQTQDPDQLDAALKRLGERYRSLLK